MAFKMEMLGRGPWQALTTLPNVIFSWFFLFYVGFGFCLADSVTTLERVGNKRTRTDSQTTPSPFNVTISQRNLCKTKKKEPHSIGCTSSGTTEKGHHLGTDMRAYRCKSPFPRKAGWKASFGTRHDVPVDFQSMAEAALLIRTPTGRRQFHF